MIFEKIRERLEELYDTNDKPKKKAYEEQDWETFNMFSCINEGVYMTIDIINQVEDEYNNGWIPCSERLPKYDEYVLCQGKNSQFIACIDSLDNKWRDNGFRVRINITHWQPLPQPPKGE